ncbi:hypothetical protein ACI79J_03905 [Geodermatophilus sp. SYSU D01062]
MTAGQGPQGWDRPGQDPHGQGVHGQGPYGQSPYGQGVYGQGVYGQASHGGYAPAPAAPDGFGAPAPVERPAAVRLGIGAWVASLVLGLLGAIVTFAQFDEIVDRALVDAGLDPAEYEGVSGVASATVVTVGIVFSLVLLGLQALFLWFAWTGRNWARVVLWVFGGLAVVGGLVSLAGPSVGGLTTLLNLAQTLLVVVAVVALAQKPASAWYRYQGWRRAQGR